jgi:Tol biopolymer transport system component
MSLRPGTFVGHYEILSALGAGGMGEVYRARDTQLGRDVAVKVLPEAVAADPDRVARFQREAQLLATLNDPHIAAIYGVAEAPACRAIVLELVEGPTLEDRIQTGSLRIDEALVIGRQIAEALEAAHARGVVHRDLKPANVKVTADGRVKVLDFGLAKLVNEEAPSGSLTMSPTLSAHATLAGVILGTAAYMSPEQARGKAVDRRTDIWAFGCVLFEMLAGKRAFAAGDTVSDVVAAILRSDPDWSALPAGTPAAIRRLLSRCLTKDPHERLHDIADARLEIRDALVGAEERTEFPRRSGPDRLAWTLVAMLGIASLTLAALVAWAITSADPEPRVYRSVLIPPGRMGFTNFGGRLALSPDGRRVAFAADGSDGRLQLWIRQLDVPDERPLPGTDGATSPFWSPDSAHVGFIVEGTLKRVPASGGPVQTLTTGAGSGGGTWNRDNVILFAHETDGRIHRISAAGGSATPVTTVDSSRAGIERHFGPYFLPDGRHFLFRIAGSAGPASAEFVNRGAGGIFVASIEAPGQTRVLERATTALFANGWLLFVRGGTLMAQRFDPERLATSGEPMPLTEELQLGPPPSFTGAFSASTTGVLVYQAGAAPTSRLVWLNRDGKETGVLGDEAQYGYLQLSPDARRALVSVRDSTTARNRDVWIYDVARGIRTRFTTDPGDEFAPVWSADGSRVVYAGSGSAGLDLFEKKASGDGKETLLTQTPGPRAAEIPASWSPNGRFVLYRTAAPFSDLHVLSLDGERRATPVGNTRFREQDGEFSPDGRWIAYSSDETGRLEVYLMPFGTEGGKIPVSSAGGELARWRPDGEELFYVAPDNRLMSVAVHNRANGALDLDQPQPLFAMNLVRGTSFPYAVTDDGRFLVITPGRNAAPLPITLLVNWPGTLKQ